MKNIIHFILTDVARSYQVLQVCRLSSVILLSIVLVQCNIASDRIGDFEWFIFLANAGSFFWGLGLKNAFMSYFPNSNSNDQSRLIFNLGIVFFLLGVSAFSVLYFIDFPRLDAMYSYLPWLFCFLVLGTVASLSEHILIVKDNAKTLFFYGVVSYSVYLFGLSYLVVQYRSIQPLLIGLGVWAMLRFLYFIKLVTDYSSLTFDLKLTWKFILFGSPLIVHVLLGAGMEYVDGYLVESYFDRSEFTYFRYGARELPINTIFISALASAFIPLAVRNLDQSLIDIKKRISRLMNFLFPASIVLTLLSPYLFALVYSEEYLVSAQIFNIYLLILCSRILLPQVILYAKQKNQVLMYAAGVEFVLNIGLSVYLMQFYGLYGIAIATVIAFFTQKIILVGYNWRILKIPISDYIDVKRYIYYCIVLYGTFCLTLFFF
ncbi:MAG: lipid II flippase MurJ [Saprospiraceae bacterium]|nr:lipid II flippase MurJ [Saprospiraceae bacterium]